MLVSQILKSKAGGVVTIAPGATLREVVELLSTRRIGGMRRVTIECGLARHRIEFDAPAEITIDNSQRLTVRAGLKVVGA